MMRTMLIAVSNQDETNMVVCQVSPLPYLRRPLRSAAYVQGRLSCKIPQSVFSDQALPMDVSNSPEKEVTKHHEQIDSLPRRLCQVMEFVKAE